MSDHYLWFQCRRNEHHTCPGFHAKCQVGCEGPFYCTCDCHERAKKSNNDVDDLLGPTTPAAKIEVLVYTGAVSVGGPLLKSTNIDDLLGP